MRVLAILLVLVATAHAEPARDTKAKAAANAGAALFDKNDYAGAAAKFREAYDLNHDPSYLFNIAQAYRHANDCVRSADYYGRFLAEVPHPPNEDKIRVWYTSELQCAKEAAAKQPVEPTKTTPGTAGTGTSGTTAGTGTSGTTPGTTAGTTPEPTPAPNTGQTAPNTGQTSGSRGGHPGIALALVGTSVVAFAVGGFFAWDAQYLEDQRRDLQDRCTTDNQCSAALVNDYNRRGSRANTLTIVGFAAGGLALAAGVTVYFVSRPSREAPVAVVPVEGGAMVTRAFAW